jgi:hypothetical protein
MKIKIKRYKEIEQIALAESLVGILEEIVPTGTSLNLANNPKIKTLQDSIRGLGFNANEQKAIEEYIKGLLINKGLQ